MQTQDAIESRRSIRKYKKEPVEEGKIHSMIKAGVWAPSGLNNQPWRFKIIEDEKTKNLLASHTHYGGLIKQAPLCIVVFLDCERSYDREKDFMAVGACIQNMLLTAHDLGLGCVWLGEILNQRKQAEKALECPSFCELAAVIAVGVPDEKPTSKRKSLDEFLL
ncbi:MAG: nitroreductase family protein [Candidatus Altiarchaeales archaeon]|nr:nitroreductase family protein [Candidatus Altiarchaeales archaeon]